MALLSNNDKILERIMYNWLYEFPKSKNQTHDQQFGFRQKHSISHALIYINIKNTRAADQNILIQKLSWGTANNWICSYLQNRTQLVSTNGSSSGLLFIRCGIPQGSIRGPLLFLAYINKTQKGPSYCGWYQPFKFLLFH